VTSDNVNNVQLQEIFEIVGPDLFFTEHEVLRNERKYTRLLSWACPVTLSSFVTI
jgi:hypothetical protein